MVRRYYIAHDDIGNDGICHDSIGHDDTEYDMMDDMALILTMALISVMVLILLDMGILQVMM